MLLFPKKKQILLHRHRRRVVVIERRKPPNAARTGGQQLMLSVSVVERSCDLSTVTIQLRPIILSLFFVKSHIHITITDYMLTVLYCIVLYYITG